MKVKVLFLAANPIGTQHLALDEEIRAITRNIRAAEHRDLIEVVQASAVRPDDLLEALLRHQPHIVHFSGHGTHSNEIVLLDRDGLPKPVSQEALVSLFGALKDNIQIVLLNACYAEAQAKAILTHIPCTIGMSAAIGDKAAITFASSFYRTLAYGRSVQTAFETGLVALQLEGIPEAHKPQLQAQPGLQTASFVLVKTEATALQCGPTPEPQRKPHHLLPPGAPYNRAWYSERPLEERAALNNLRSPGTPAILWGPRRSGKSWLLRHLVEVLTNDPKERDCCVVTVDFGAVSTNARSSLDTFLQDLAIKIVEGVNAPTDWVVEAWQRPGNSMRKLGWLMESRILLTVPDRFVLAIDQADNLLGTGVQNDFIGMVRSWALDFGDAWQRLRFLLAVSTTPAQLTPGSTFSLLNIVDPIELKDMKNKQLRMLSDRHGLNWDDEKLQCLINHVGGHAYLNHLTMYECALNGRALNDVLADVDNMESVFAKHLRSWMNFVRSHSQLTEGVCRVLADPTTSLEEEVYYRLHEAGIIIKAKINGRSVYRIRYRVCEDYLRTHLCQTQ